jgi:hypothetical protein
MYGINLRSKKSALLRLRRPPRMRQSEWRADRHDAVPGRALGRWGKLGRGELGRVDFKNSNVSKGIGAQ